MQAERATDSQLRTSKAALFHFRNVAVATVTTAGREDRNERRRHLSLCTVAVLRFGQRAHLKTSDFALSRATECKRPANPTLRDG